VLHRFPSGTLPYEEALQAGRIALWRALLHFDPARGTTFSTYAVVAIRRRIHLAEQRFQRFWRARPLLSPPPAPDLLEEAQRSILAEAVQHWVAQLVPRRAGIVRAYYGLSGARPQTQQAIAQTLGVSHQRVHQLLHEARLLLALPVYSWPIRLLLERTSRQDLRAARRAYSRFCRQRRPS
jgi:RNA polymerase sigma factor (sigma-70 family)